MSTKQLQALPSAKDKPAQDEPANDDSFPLRHIQDALRGLQFGSITVIVQDGVVVQVERTEKRRYQRGRRL